MIENDWLTSTLIRGIFRLWQFAPAFLWARFTVSINLLSAYNSLATILTLLVTYMECSRTVSLGVHSQWNDVRQWQESAAYG